MEFFFPLLQGSDCVHPFVALQSCIKANPNAFAKDVLEDDDDEVKEEEEPAQEYKIIPPEWSTESQSPRQRLASFFLLASHMRIE